MQARGGLWRRNNCALARYGTLRKSVDPHQMLLTKVLDHKEQKEYCIHMAFHGLMVTKKLVNEFPQNLVTVEVRTKKQLTEFWQRSK